MTGLVRTSIFDGFATRERITIGIFENLFGKSVEQGAQTSIYLATEKLPKESINGKFFADCRPIGKQIDKFAPHDMLDSFWDYTNRQLWSKTILRINLSFSNKSNEKIEQLCDTQLSNL